MKYELKPLTVLIMCQNEEKNIRYALDSIVGHASQVIVTDSFSTDQTIEIVKKDYPSVDLYQNQFIHWAEQRNWMLENCDIKNEIVLFLDADEQVPAKLFDEIAEVEKSGRAWIAADVEIQYYFLGSYLPHAYGHPRIKRVFKKTNLRFMGEGAREFAMVSGECISLKSPLIHRDHKPLEAWLLRHIRNAEREANAFIETDKRLGDAVRRELKGKLRLKLWIRNQIWNRLPLLMRPFFYFFFRYVIQKGFLDGVPGLVYCYLHAIWYMGIIDIRIYEHKRGLEKCCDI
jgi:glycosyltransferase involved in cell wall biosynthesis